MPDEDNGRRVRFRGEELGFLTLYDIGALCARGRLDQTAEIWSPRGRTWRRLTELLFDFYPDRLSQMKAAGIVLVEILGSGLDDECPACAALVGKRFPIDSIPAIPPANCACLPWCKVMEIAIAGGA
jgi:hypothetical protein